MLWPEAEGLARGVVLGDGLAIPVSRGLAKGLGLFSLGLAKGLLSKGLPRRLGGRLLLMAEEW